jgi:hypothetical protein
MAPIAGATLGQIGIEALKARSGDLPRLSISPGKNISLRSSVEADLLIRAIPYPE